jgi:hypothetical protein
MNIQIIAFDYKADKLEILEKAELIVYILGTPDELSLINNRIIGQNENDFLFSKIQFDLTEKRVNILFECVQKPQFKARGSSSSKKIRYDGDHNDDYKDDTRALKMEDLLLSHQIINMTTNQTMCDSTAMSSSKIESSLVSPNETNCLVNKQVVDKENQSDDESQIDLYLLPSQMMQFVKKLNMSSEPTNTNNFSASEFPCGHFKEMHKKLVYTLTVKEIAELLKKVYKREVNKNKSQFAVEMKRNNETTVDSFCVHNYEDLLKN